jgi:hypothetical protein
VIFCQQLGTVGVIDNDGIPAGDPRYKWIVARTDFDEPHILGEGTGQTLCAIHRPSVHILLGE